MDKRKRILVVDDEERHRELLEAMLESLGYDFSAFGRFDAGDERSGDR